MGAQFRSALLAGFIASTAWMFFAVAFDMSKNGVLIGGVVFLVGVAAVTAVIDSMISKQHSRTP